MSDTIKLLVSYLTASALAIGGVLIAAWAWIQPPVDPPRDLAILYGILGIVIGGATGFLFGQESATRAVRSYERGRGGPPANTTDTTTIEGPIDG